MPQMSMVLEAKSPVSTIVVTNVIYNFDKKMVSKVIYAENVIYLFKNKLIFTAMLETDSESDSEDARYCERQTIVQTADNVDCGLSLSS